MADWAATHLDCCGAESFSRFAQISKAPNALVDNGTLRSALLDFVADFSNWDNASATPYLETSRSLTRSAHLALGGAPDSRPLVVDPFAGGGSIPLEAARLGADTFASDLNAVPVMLNKVMLEYVPKFGRGLAEKLRSVGREIDERVRHEALPFLPPDEDGSVPLAYFWARQARCEGVGCGAVIPLIRSTALTRREPFAHIAIHGRNAEVDIALREGPEACSTATIRGGKATCPCCGYTLPARNIKAQLTLENGGANRARLYAVLTLDADRKRRFRSPTPADAEALSAAVRYLEAAVSAEPSLLPTESINPLRPYKNTVGVCIVTRLGISQFAHLYTARQLAGLLLYRHVIHDVVGRGAVGGGELGRALGTTLAIAFDRLVMQNSSLSRWHTARSTIEGMFSKQALQIIWDFVEANPTSGVMASWRSAVDWVAQVVEAHAGLLRPGTAVVAAAHLCPLPDDSVDLLFTDPPYFAAIPYADLSDVFHVWLRRVLPNDDREMFREATSAKADELIVTNANLGPGGEVKDASFFASKMTAALEHARAVSRPGAIGCVVFADASTSSWEALLSAVIASGWTLTASWPIDTELQNRTRARDSASLQSSVFMVCRPRESVDGVVDLDSVGEWRQILAALPRRIHEWMPRLAAEGVVGADAIFACLGPALEIFSRYSRVERANGEVVTLREYLEEVWAAVSREALSMIFEDPETAGLDGDARVTAMWLWTIAAPTGPPSGADGEDDDTASADEDETPRTSSLEGGFALEFDAARKIAQGLGAKLGDLTQVIEVKGDRARLLSVVERTRHLFGGGDAALPARKPVKGKQRVLFDELEEVAEAYELGEVGAPKVGRTTLDRVHQAMILFGAGRGEAMKRFLVEDGAGRQSQFWKLAQALSALYPAGTDEKRWVDGVLARKKGLGF